MDCNAPSSAFYTISTMHYLHWMCINCYCLIANIKTKPKNCVMKILLNGKILTVGPVLSRTHDGAHMHTCYNVNCLKLDLAN